AMISCRKITESSQRVQFYLSQVMEALGHFRETIWNLYCAPRIAEPVWLTMMSCTTEKSQLCQHFLKELAYLTEQLNKNQFFAALITAVLTYHLAWVPTVMPNDHPPIKSFCEKHTSQSVNLLAKSHPYNPLWAQLGDLYGAIGSPVRMTRTVVAGKRKDLVQRILYILTYFIRCSELQENHLSPKEREQMVQGSNVTTSLEKGEVEDSDYVLITLNKESALLAPSLPCNGGESPVNGLEPSNTSVPREHTTDVCSPSTQRSAKSTSHEANLGDGGSCKKRITLVKEAKVETLVSVTRTPVYNVEDVFTSNSLTSHVKSRHHTGQYNKKASAPVQLSDWAKEVLRADQKDERYSPGKVNYTVGQSTTSHADVETCRKELDENGKSVRCKSEQPSAPKPYSLAADRRRLMHSRIPSCEGGSSLFDEYFVEGNSIETNTVECLPGHSLLSEKCFVSTIVEDNCTSGRTCEKDQISPANTEAHRPQKTSQTVPCGDPLRRTGGRLEGNIPRNRSYDSALGHSEEELNAGRTLLESQDHNNDHAEVELPLPRSDVISSSSVKNFGRSLFGGYCSSYMPDMVLHGIASAEKLKSCLLASLAHATHHPVLDEPLAEAVCIVADTDKCSVQVVSSQKTTVDNVKLGTDVLVSSQVCSLLQSIVQLHKLKMPPMFCVMHLEDKLQELYLKSKMLSEYLRGHTRVHVKELGVVLGMLAFSKRFEASLGKKYGSQGPGGESNMHSIKSSMHIFGIAAFRISQSINKQTINLITKWHSKKKIEIPELVFWSSDSNKSQPTSDTSYSNKLSQQQVTAKSTAKKQRRVVVVGDSLLRGTEAAICRPDITAREVCCLPGAMIKDVTDRIPKLFSSKDVHPFLLIHVGTNDTARKDLPTICKDFEELGKKVKELDAQVVFSSILPVDGHGTRRWNRILDANNWLRRWCRQQGFGFLDHGVNYWYDGLLARDGLHLNKPGKHTFARRLATLIRRALN
ncbi:unnamed protein product, partial [Ranitomeya imitator]